MFVVLFSAVEDSDYTIPEKRIIFTSGNSSSCVVLNIENDDILENDENIALTVMPSMEDSSVVIISAVHNRLVITLEDDDG